MPKAGTGAVHQAWVYFRQRLPSQAETVHHTRAEVFDDDIRASRQPLGHLNSRLLLKVDRDTSLIAIQAQVGSTFAVEVQIGHAPVAHPVAFWRFHLNDLRSQVAQNLGCVRTLRQLAEIKDHYAAE